MYELQLLEMNADWLKFLDAANSLEFPIQMKIY